MTVIEKDGTLHKLCFRNNKPDGDVQTTTYGGAEFFAQKLDERNTMSYVGDASNM